MIPFDSPDVFYHDPGVRSLVGVHFHVLVSFNELINLIFDHICHQLWLSQSRHPVLILVLSAACEMDLLVFDDMQRLANLFEKDVP